MLKGMSVLRDVVVQLFLKHFLKGKKLIEDTRMEATKGEKDNSERGEKEKKRREKMEKKKEKRRSGIKEAMEGIVARKRNENFFQRICSLRVLYKHLERILVKEIEGHKR